MVRSARGAPERGAGSPNGLTEGFYNAVDEQTPPVSLTLNHLPFPGEAWALRAGTFFHTISVKNLVPRKAKSVFTFSAKYDIIRLNKRWDFARRHSLSKHLPANLLKGRDAKFKCLTRIFPA